jgi:hypothetical protein
MPDSLHPCTESKPARRQPGEHCRRQCGGVATRGTFQPRQGRAAANVIWDLFRGSFRTLVSWSGRSEEAPSGPGTQIPSILSLESSWEALWVFPENL